MSKLFKIPLGITTSEYDEFRWEFEPVEHDGGFTTHHGEIRIATLAEAMVCIPPKIVRLVSCRDKDGNRRDDLMGAMIARYGVNIVSSRWFRNMDKDGPAIVRSLLH